MPYTKKQIQSRESYQNIIDADKNELKKFFEDEDLKAKISGSLPDAIRTLRDSNGMMLSYEDPDKPGKTYPSNIQLTRIKLEYHDTVPKEVTTKLKKERTFGEGFRPVPDVLTDEDSRIANILQREGEIEEIEKKLKIKEDDIDKLNEDLTKAISDYADKLAELQGDTGE